MNPKGAEFCEKCEVSLIKKEGPRVKRKPPRKEKPRKYPKQPPKKQPPHPSPPPKKPPYPYPPPHQQPYPYPPPHQQPYPYPPPHQQPYPYPPPHQQPYPYPPPPYPYPYYYPYPYPVPYYPPPSLYGDLYEKPPEQPRLRLDILPKVMFKPKEAFQEIYPHTTKIQGILAVLFLSIIYTAIQIAFYLLSEYLVSGWTNYSVWFAGYPGFLPYPIIQFIFSIPIAIISLYLTGYFSAVITRELRGRRDVDKTIGLLGYGYIVSVVLGFITLIILLSIGPSPFTDQSLDTIFIFIIVFFILIIINLIWTLWVNGYAIAIANNVSLGRGIVAYFLAQIVVGIIAFLIMIPLMGFIFLLGFPY